MQLPERIFAPKTNQEFRLLLALYHCADESGSVQVTMDELTELTHMQREAQRRALRRLEECGLVRTTRTFLGAGRFASNSYQLLLQDDSE